MEAVKSVADSRIGTQIQGETIVAVATPPGKGAISIVRLSGPETKGLISRRFRRSRERHWRERQAALGHFLDLDGTPLDRVLVTLFPEPNSYTGEDVAEISCHGSPPVTRRVVETLLQEGARFARPGEFTLRAFLNGKMDLAQAEAVRDLIESQTAFQAQLATQQLEGKLSRTLEPLKQDLVGIISHMETALEFVEDDVEPEARQRLISSLEGIADALEGLAESFRLGRIIHDGLWVTIVGKPNVGKSSLFNALLHENRAIVTEIPGTTRDALTETLSLEGIPTRLVDTAGIREARDLVEQLGVQKSLQSIPESDVVLFVLDASTPFEEEDQQIWEVVKSLPCVLVLNKVDLTSRVQVPEEVKKSCAALLTVSALCGTHLPELKSALLDVVAPEQSFETERVMVTNIRHQCCLERARTHLQSGLESYRKGLSEEFPLYDFRKTLDTLGEITGETTVEDILDQIFSTFCIGK